MKIIMIFFMTVMSFDTALATTNTEDRTLIIGIHGLLNKPPHDVLEDWWKQALDEGLNRNLEKSLEYEFELVYVRILGSL